jgi:dTDP-4-amino-4,6-dideoxygalactose transaminase
MTTGEGGMVVTNDDRIAEQVRLMRSHGMTSLTWDRHQGHAWSYDVIGVGYNYRIDELRSALGRVQLARLDHNNARRKELTDLYHSHFAESAPMVTVPFKNHPGSSAYHIMPILLPAGVNRTRFMEEMKSRGIQTSIHYPPIHKFSAYAEYHQVELPITQAVAAREVTLPLFPSMTEEMVQYVVHSTREVLHGA